MQNQEIIPTAEEFCQSNSLVDKYGKADKLVAEAMIEFAKLHVEAALKKASKQKTHGMMVVSLFNEEQQKSILNAYSLTNIK
jgi:hypothetical protein